MKKSILISILVISFAVTAISGATLAWFTNEAEPLVNEFTSGTVGLIGDSSRGVLTTTKEVKKEPRELSPISNISIRVC